jgi:hypothetical protein
LHTHNIPEFDISHHSDRTAPPLRVEAVEEWKSTGTEATEDLRREI